MKKMNKILLTLILGIFIVGTLGALSFESIKSDFKTKVLTLDPNKLCQQSKDLSNNYKFSSCKDNMKLINVDDSLISITQNKEGIIKVQAK